MHFLILCATRVLAIEHAGQLQTFKVAFKKTPMTPHRSGHTHRTATPIAATWAEGSEESPSSSPAVPAGAIF